MRTRFSYNAALFGLIALVASCVLQAQNIDNTNTEFSLSASNDAFLLIGDDLDRFYSFGFNTSLKFKNKKVLGLEKIFKNKLDYYYEIGLHIEGYAPTVKEVTDFQIQTNTISFDRPFAGVTYGAFQMNYAFDRSNLKSGFIIGIMGEKSMAGDIQSWFHENITNDPIFTDEWIYQVPNQFIFNINTTYTYDFLPQKKWYDVYGSIETQLGNLNINATPTLGLRLGKFKKLSQSISLDNSILGNNNYEFFYQSTYSLTANGYDATAQGNIFNSDFQFAINDLNNFHTTITHSLYLVYSRYSIGYEQFFTRGKTLVNAQHSFSRILIRYRF